MPQLHSHIIHIGVVLFQINLDGGSNEVISPKVEPVDVRKIEVIILKEKGLSSLSAVDIVVCCDPKGILIEATNMCYL